jgi:predicted TIM-barrel fold metal-dependent hydrolase
MSGAGFAVPPGACDCHVHVFADAGRFPFVRKRVYTPPPAPVADLDTYLAALRLGRVVIIQPSIYGADNAALLDSIEGLGLERARGVAVIDDGISDAALDDMHSRGVRGVRVNLEMDGEHDPGRSARRLRETAGRIARLGWHLQLFCLADMIARLADVLAGLPVPVVLDHLGGIEAGRGPGQAGFGVVLALLKAGNAYVKASGAYLCSDRAPDFPDVVPFAQAVIAANPDRIVWGSNWPHPDGARVSGRDPFSVRPFLPVGHAETLNLLACWAPDVEARRRILVDNPARLYGF